MYARCISLFTQNGETALHKAAGKGLLEIMIRLLQAGADVSLQANVSVLLIVFYFVPI